MSKRAALLFSLLFCGFCGLMTRFLALSAGNAARAVAGQSTATLTVATVRGTVYDRQMRPLVNAGRQTRFWVPPHSRTLAALAEAMPAETFSALAERLQGGRPVVAIGEEDWPEAEGVLRFRVPVRYGDTLFAPHLVGYATAEGVTGIEAAYDGFLREQAGAVTVTCEINAAGSPLIGSRPTVTDTLEQGRAGVVLTVDRDIQIFAEGIAKEYLRRGAVLVLDASSCQVLAAVSVPAFQPEEVADLLKDPEAPLLDRTLCNYDCGSVFKIVSAAAALEAGVSPDRRYTCAGSVTVEGVTFHCHNRLGHGELDMTGAFAASCNCYFIQLMGEVGPEAMYYTAAALGFDRPILPAENYKTARAAIPTLEELQASPPALANLSFGQGALLATPYHIAQLVATVVNGGEVRRPSAVLGTVDAEGYLTPAPDTPPGAGFSLETAVILKKMMIAAVGEGSTGAAANPINGGAGGKSGTAESGWLTSSGKAVQSWFAGFYPAAAPRYVVVVLAEDSGATGASAAGVFHRLCDGLYTFQ